MDDTGKLVGRLIDEDALIFAVLCNKRRKSAEVRKVTLRPVLLRDNVCYQAEYHFEKRVTQENFLKDEVEGFVDRLLATDFKQLDIFATDADYSVLANKPESPKIIKNPPTRTATCISHNKERVYVIPEGTPCDFLIRLGVMTKDGQIVPRHRDKFRQINRFLEIVEDCISYIPEHPSIIDFGCGKSYLTFAMYYYLNVINNYGAKLVGLDLKEDVIAFCNSVAKDLNYDDLVFSVGDIAEYDESAKADMVVTLHACDTATDFALMKADAWSARVILSVPCCQHELFSQLKNQEQSAILKHGILKERFSAILTDALRALKLEECGYKVDMIEFISLEHTAKNIMLRCIKSNVPPEKKSQAALEFSRLCQYWNVNPTIAKLTHSW